MDMISMDNKIISSFLPYPMNPIPVDMRSYEEKQIDLIIDSMLEGKLYGEEAMIEKARIKKKLGFKNGCPCEEVK